MKKNAPPTSANDDLRKQHECMVPFRCRIRGNSSFIFKWLPNDAGCISREVNIYNEAKPSKEHQIRNNRGYMQRQ